MNTKQKNPKNFYLKAFLISFSITTIVYSFMILQFWWGNHDWNPLRYGLNQKDLFFEARYSQLIPMTILLNGQILPPFLFILSFALLSFLGLLLAKHLSLPQKKLYYITFSLLLILSPHTPILFYYLFITFPLLFWGCIGISLLFLSQKPYKIWKIILGSFGFFLLLGSYPPILALIFTIFIGKLLHNYLTSKQNIKQITINGLFFIAQLILATIGYKITCIYLKHLGLLNPKMYNISLRSPSDIISQILPESIAPITQLPFLYNSFGTTYTIFYSLILLGGLWQIFRLLPNKLMAIIFSLSLFLASRVSFILSPEASQAVFRISWWGNTGIIAVFLSLLYKNKQTIIRNLLFAISIFFIISFSKTDYEVQKVQYLSFHAERLFHKRVEERLFSFQEFSLDNDYLSLSLGYPNFHHHFCYNDCQKFNNELLSATVMPADFGQVIFWDEIKNPLIAKYGVWNNKLWLVIDRHLKNFTSQDLTSNLNNLRLWMYIKAQNYPHQNSIFIDNKLIVFNFDDVFFNKNKETVLRSLDYFSKK